MRKLIALIIIALLVLGLSGCGEGNSHDSKGMMIRISEANRYEICYDKETKVEYLISNRGGVSPLYTSDGTLKLYTEDGE